MNSNKPIAVIILNWNGHDLLNEYLPQVVATTDSAVADIIVADNGSTDNSVELLKAKFPDVKLLQFGTNHGFAQGYNLAIEQTQYKYTILLNSDVATAPGWITPLYEYMEANPNVGACQPKLLAYKQKDEFEYAGASGGFIDRNGYPYCRGRIFGTVEKDHGQYDDVISVFWATGAALMIRSQVYLTAGGLDKDFFAHMEEIDLCWRVLLMGYDIKVVPQSLVYHLGGGSLPASNPRKTYLNFRNNLLMLHKNLPDSTRSRKLFVRRLLDTIAWAKFMATFDFKNANAILKAHNDFRTMRKRYTSHPDIDLLDQRSDTHRNIIVDYYLRGRKTWK
ncbi:MAG: glycosyltransferase family 2 protein [Muribaculaceae bacterium]|nr:glycosyltransferase family 2 protein [Muribaculaceae bacterium]